MQATAARTRPKTLERAPSRAGGSRPPQLLSQNSQLCMVALRGAVIDKRPIALVNCHDTSGVFYRTPILLSQRRDFPNLRDESVRIRTIRTIDLLNYVKICEMTPVNDHIVTSADGRNADKWEPNQLVD